MAVSVTLVVDTCLYSAKVVRSSKNTHCILIGQVLRTRQIARYKTKCWLGGARLEELLIFFTQTRADSAFYVSFLGLLRP